VSEVGEVMSSSSPYLPIVGLRSIRSPDMDHSSVSFEVIDPSWPVVETKVAPWGGDDHTIN
jgi:hypothetical protein